MKQSCLEETTSQPHRRNRARRGFALTASAVLAADQPTLGVHGVPVVRRPPARDGQDALAGLVFDRYGIAGARAAGHPAVTPMPVNRERLARVAIVDRDIRQIAKGVCLKAESDQRNGDRKTVHHWLYLRPIGF